MAIIIESRCRYITGLCTHSDRKNSNLTCELHRGKSSRAMQRAVIYRAARKVEASTERAGNKQEIITIVQLLLNAEVDSMRRYTRTLLAAVHQKSPR